MKLQLQFEKFGYCFIRIKRKQLLPLENNNYYSLTCYLSMYLLPDKTI